tara:strand:+ start:1321 stop:1698 length:378 start_codon:yes stop_codon:yes gene_type:complete
LNFQSSKFRRLSLIKIQSKEVPKNIFLNSKKTYINELMKSPILYVKQGCPWCIDAIEFFKKIGLSLDIIDVIKNPDSMKDLIECSGQNKTPTLKNGNFVVADFDIDEFKMAMSKNPAEAKKLGFN